jgi:Tol biopolymer transport system component
MNSRQTRYKSAGARDSCIDISARQSPAWGQLLLSIVFGALIPAEASGAVVFSALEKGRWAVYWQAALGTRPQLVLEDTGADQTAARIAPNGKEIAFETSRSEIVVVQQSADTSWTLALTMTNAVRPAWNAGASNWVFVRFALSTTGEDSDLFSWSYAKRAAELLIRHTGNQDYPHVSGDGTKVAYISTQVVGVRQGTISAFQQLWIVDLSRSQPRSLWLEGQEKTDPVWSPSGEQIAFASNQSGQFEIWIVRSDGSGPRQITSGPGAKTRPSWSPDGRRLLFTQLLEGRHELALVDVDGKNLSVFKPFGEQRAVEVRDADWK